MLLKLRALILGWFRVCCALFAGMSLLVAILLIHEGLQTGYVVVEGVRETGLGAILTSAMVPLLGVGIGVAGYFLVPRASQVTDRS